MTDATSMGKNTSPDHQNEERFDLSGGSEHHPCVHLAALAPHSSHLQVSHLLHYCFWSITFPISSSTILTVCDFILETFTNSSVLVRTSLDFLLSPNFESSWFFSGGRITPIKMQNHCKIFCYSSSGQSVKLRTYVLEKNRFTWICPEIWGPDISSLEWTTLRLQEYFASMHWVYISFQRCFG